MTRTLGVKRALLFASVCLLTLAALFQFAYGPCRLTWGATSEEASRPMPGDEIIKNPTFNATLGSVMKAMMRMREPQAPQVRGSSSKIFRSRRAQVLRASLEKSELSPASGEGAPAARLWACLPAQAILCYIRFNPA